MYNVELKSKFIEERYKKTPALAVSAKGLFSVLEEREREWQADVCTRSAEEISDFLNSTVKRSVRGDSGANRKRQAILINYIQWCIQNGVDGANEDALNIQKPKSNKSMKDNIFTNPDDLARHLDGVFDKVEDETTDIIYRCYCWMAYMGFQELEAFEVRRGDVDLERLKIVYEHIEYPIYQQSVAAFEKCATLTQFKIPRYRYIYTADRVKGNRLLRGLSENVTTSGRMQHELSRRTTKALNAGSISRRASYYQIWLSGHFYRAYELENAQDVTPISPKEYFGRLADKQMSTVKYALHNHGTTLTTIKNRQVKNYLQDYETWKSFMEEQE